MCVPFVQAVIFDLGKVIVDFDHRVISARLAQTSTYSEETVFQTVFSPELVRRVDSGNLRLKDFYEILRKKLNLKISLHTFKHIWNDIFSINPGIDILLHRLASRYRLLCLSNTNHWHFEHCRKQFPVLDLFHSFILSYKVGTCKPDPDIYRHAVAAAETEACRCVYVDDIPEFVTAGEAIGLRGVHFVSVPQLTHVLQGMGVIAANSF